MSDISYVMHTSKSRCQENYSLQHSEFLIRYNFSYVKYIEEYFSCSFVL